MSRAVAALALVGVVALELLVQLWRGPAWSDAVGTVLYAIAGYLVLAIVRPTAAPRTLGLVALAVCVAVGVAQLTGIPARIPFARLVLGTTFSWADLPWYAVGAAVATGIDTLLRR